MQFDNLTHTPLRLASSHREYFEEESRVECDGLHRKRLSEQLTKYVNRDRLKTLGRAKPRRGEVSLDVSEKRICVKARRGEA